MTTPGDVVVLHPSVPVLWWLRHRPYAANADRFLLEDLASARTRLLVVEGLQSRVLGEIARDLADVGLHPEIAGQLFDDVTRQIRLLVDHGAAHVMERLPLARAAFSLASQYGIPLYDAEVAILAEVTRLPLLISGAQRASQMSVALGRRLARVVLLEPIRSLPPAERRGIADAAEDAEDFSDLPIRYQQMLVEAEHAHLQLLAEKRRRATD